MMELLLPEMVGQSVVASGYEIDNSVYLDGSDYLYRNFSAEGDRQKFTISIWLKKDIGIRTEEAASAGSSPTDRGNLEIENNEVQFYSRSGDSNDDLSSANGYGVNDREWHHFCIAVDTTQAIASDRYTMWIDGDEPASWDNEDYPSLNKEEVWMDNRTHRFGTGWDKSSKVRGYMAECILIDGTAYSATDFAEDDGGNWIPKDPSALTFGNEGCWLRFQNASDLGEDSSGNGNNFSESGNPSQSSDTPTS